MLRGIAAASPCDLWVFSHCGRSDGATRSSDVLSEQTIINLIARKITAFDMDLVATTDGKLVVGHPVSMARGLNYDVRSSTLAAARRHLPRSAPPLLLAHRLLDLAHDWNLTLALDLKGNAEPAMLPQLQYLIRGILSRGISSRTWIWLESAGTAAALQRALGSVAFQRLVLLKPLRDRLAPAVVQASDTDCSLQVAGAGHEWAQMLGPSSRCMQPRLVASLHARTWASPRRYLTWVVDDEAEMSRVLALGVDMVISNEPLKIRAAARRQCRVVRQRRQERRLVGVRGGQGTAANQ